MRARYLPGDVVSRRKGLVMHKGIALSGGRILHNTPFRGEHICSEDEFRAGHRLYVKHLSDTERRRVLDHTQEWAPGRNYHLIANNCEHTVTRAVHGLPHSPQLIGWAAGLVAGAAALAVTRNAGAAAASYAVAKKLAQKALKSFL